MKYNSDESLTLFGFGEHRATTIAIEQFLGNDDIPFYVQREIGNILTTLRKPGTVDWTRLSVIDPSRSPYVTKALSDAAYGDGHNSWDAGQARVMIEDADHLLDPRRPATIHGLGRGAIGFPEA